MMWMMAICCGLPILLILFFGAGGLALGASIWIVLGAMALMIVLHLLLMRRHKHNDKKDGEHSHGCH